MTFAFWKILVFSRVLHFHYKITREIKEKLKIKHKRAHDFFLGEEGRVAKSFIAVVQDSPRTD